MHKPKLPLTLFHRRSDRCDELPFCTPAPSAIILSNDLIYARFNLYPVSPGHLLAIHFRHVASFFEATAPGQAALLSLVHDARRLLDERYAPDGYNIRVNNESGGRVSMAV
jgi:diadenosine tetraphosphate (Ap4A) HIT family hydrolase